MVLSELNFTSQLDDEDDATIALLVPVIRAQHIASALSIAEFCHQHSVQWGVDHVPNSILQPINAALAVVTNDLEPAENKSAFVKLTVGLYALSRRSISAESMIRMLKLKLRQKRLMSSSDIDKLFQDAKNHWETSLQHTQAVLTATVDGERPWMATPKADGHGGKAKEINPTADDGYNQLLENWGNFTLGVPSSGSSAAS
jgi:hypothetical protein